MGANFASEYKAAHPDELGPNGAVRVCIGGGAGFIGSHIAKRLKEEVGNTFYELSKIYFLSYAGMLCCMRRLERE